ncbi:carbohydrate ABC transporter permease [Piscibacillus sp. B03]|uniref:carbohydrate ABC transporter permease n=1 Tax=Piscibacillus sp. B03 TaxID=3457430 RepID=UPI003FCE513F
MNQPGLEQYEVKVKSNNKKKFIKVKHNTFSKFVSYFVLTLLAGITVLPFIWTLSTSLKSSSEPVFSNPPKLIPEDLTIQNFIEVWNTLPIPTFLFNSFILTFFGVLFPLLFASLAGFALGRIDFKGNKIVFIAIIATMMIPVEASMIPIYLILNEFNLIGTYTGVILPGAVNAFGIFLMRQAFKSIPKEIEESAIMDGANIFQMWWRILLPMTKPMLATLAILSFIAAWNNFLWPLLVLKDSSMYPLTLGLYKLEGAFSANTRQIATGTIIALIPILIVFLALQKHFVDNSSSGSIKG